MRHMRRLHQIALPLALMFLSLSSWADAREALAQFVTQVRSAKVQFVQRVQEPGREGKPGRVKTSSGDLSFNRPNRLRLNYLKPYAQTLVADGQQIWFFDTDLEQVTVKPQSAEWDQTAIGVIATVSNLKALERSHRVQVLPDESGLSWVSLQPLAPDQTSKDIRLGWQDGQLVSMVVEDALGHRSHWTLSQWQINPKWSSDYFHFAVPPGVEVIRTR